jgi:hypothetical protein
MINYNKSRKEQQVDKLQEDFIVWAESRAAELEITVDYFIAEFCS